MSFYYVIYLGLILSALVLSAIAVKVGNKKSLYLLLVLSATLITELYPTIIINTHVDFGWAYHLFNPLEYTFFCIYYLKSSDNHFLKIAAKYSIPVFVTLSLCISYFYYHFFSMPAININIEGFLLFILYTHLLFSINIPIGVAIYKHPDFWISIAMLIFFGSIFVFLGLYPYLFNVSRVQTNQLFNLITKPANIIFYSCIIIGILCSIKSRRYFIS